MIIKTTFKSHFKIKKNFCKNLKKKIFVKNIIIFLLFTKIFFRGCVVSFFFTRNKTNRTDVLKAPSRHKKFFHQIYYEFFNIKVIFNFKEGVLKKTTYPSTDLVYCFESLSNIFKRMGSNTLTRVKFIVSFKTNTNLNFF